jgi:hypothetical protein
MLTGRISQGSRPCAPGGRRLTWPWVLARTSNGPRSGRGRITGGAELASARRSRVVRRGPNGTALVTDGPYAESAEQISGFYLVSIDDEDALVEAAEILIGSHPAVEIRPVESSGSD